MAHRHRAWRFRLYPTREQAQALAATAGVCRYVYNLALEQRRDWWRQHRRATGKSITFASQCLELTALRREVDWIRARSQDAQQQALRDLHQAYANFFAGRAGHPSPRKRGLNDAFRLPAKETSFRRLNRSWGAVRVPNVGEVRFRWTRNIQGRLLSVSLRRDDLGWHVAFACDPGEIEAPVSIEPAVGIDRGVTRTLAFSDGDFKDLPRQRLNVLDRRARKQARALARKRRGSRRREGAKRTLARTRGKAARVRRQFAHAESRRIADAYGVVVVEKLATKNLMASARGTVEAPGRGVRAKAGLNRAIAEQGWHQFATLLGYKLTERGGELRAVSPAYTSQTCSGCGIVDKTSRKSQAAFECGHCGHSANADTNAAVNILRAGTRPAPSGRFPGGKVRQRKSRVAA